MKLDWWDWLVLALLGIVAVWQAVEGNVVATVANIGIAVMYGWVTQLCRHNELLRVQLAEALKEREILRFSLQSVRTKARNAAVRGGAR